MCQDSRHISTLPLPSPYFKLPLSLASTQLTSSLSLFPPTSILNTAVRTIFIKNKSDHAIPLLKILRGLSLSFRVKVRALRVSGRINLPWSPSSVRTSSHFLFLISPASTLALIILSTLSLRGVCTPDLSVRKLCVQASAWPALYLLSGLCSDTISHWNLPWPSFLSETFLSHWNLPCNYVNYNCPQALLSGLLCLILCFSFLLST